MPQLDQVTFFSQFFWLCVFFFGFYFAICKHFLPQMSRILKFRRKKTAGGEGVEILQQERHKARTSGAVVVENGLKWSSTFLLSHLQQMEGWYKGVIVDTNKGQLQTPNSLYIEWVGDNSIRRELALQGILLPFSPVVFASICSEKCLTRRKGAPISQSPGSSRPDSLDQPLSERKKREAALPGGRKGGRTSQRG